MADYEIDHGEPEDTRAEARSRARDREDAADAIAEAEGASPRREAARAAAVARIEEGGRQRHAVDAVGLAVAGLCGQGLGGATRIEPWNIGASLGLLAALAGLGLAGWLWRRPRLVADTMHGMPVPLDDMTIARMGMQDARKRAAERQRREDEYARLELLAAELAVLYRPLRLAAWGAAAGTLCGWACAFAGPNGSAPLAASVAALGGAVLAWRIAGGGWTEQLVQRTVILGLPAAGLVAALLLTTPPGYAAGGAAAAAAAGWIWRKRLSDLAGCTAEPPEAVAKP